MCRVQSFWQAETGQLECRWTEAGRKVDYDPPWMQTTSQIPEPYLPPLPDFASRSPFGGGAWFQPPRD